MRKYIKKIFIFLFVLLFGSQMIGCGGSSHSDNSNSNNNESNKKILVKIEGIVTKDINKDIDVTLLGAKVYNSQNSVISKINIKSNESKDLTLYVKSSSSEDLRILVKIKGYIDNGITIQTKSLKDGDKSIIQMIPAKSGKVKDGIFVKRGEVKGVDNSAVTQKDITIKVKEKETTPEVAITIPKETKLTDKDGNIVIPTSSTVVQFNPLKLDVINAYPGGLNVMANVDDTMEQVNFISAGFTSIILEDKNGNKVRNFDKPIKITMQIQKGIRDGDGNIVQIGDSVPIWSYHEDKGIWNYEKDGIVRDINSSDNLYDVVFYTDHLTYYNFDWKGSCCTAYFDMKKILPKELINKRLKVNIKVDSFNLNKSLTYYGDGFIEIARYPCNGSEVKWKLYFYDISTKKLVHEYSETSNVCINSCKRNCGRCIVKRKTCYDNSVVVWCQGDNEPNCPKPTGGEGGN